MGENLIRPRREYVEPEARVRPFHCGSQDADWSASNCNRCTEVFDGQDFRCEIQKDLNTAYFDDGTVSAEIGRRMGFVAGSLAYVWACPEVEWTEAWKAEWAYRQTWRYRAKRAFWRVMLAGRKGRYAVQREAKSRFADVLIAARPKACQMAFVLWSVGAGGWPGLKGIPCDGGKTCSCWPEPEIEDNGMPPAF